MATEIQEQLDGSIWWTSERGEEGRGREHEMDESWTRLDWTCE